MNRAHAPRGTYAHFFFRCRLVFFGGGGGMFFFGGGGHVFFFWVWDACESDYLTLTLTFKNMDGFFGQRVGSTNFLEVCFLSHSLI